MSEIVVGVDGSAPSKQALAWAADEAKRRGSTLRVVMAWDNPNKDMWIPRIRPGADHPLQLIEGALDRLVHEVLGRRPSVAIERVAVEGPPAKILVAQAKSADLLVVGNRGHGGLTEALLGSVGQYCVRHATCPVVIMRGK